MSKAAGSLESFFEQGDLLSGVIAFLEPGELCRLSQTNSVLHDAINRQLFQTCCQCLPLTIGIGTNYNVHLSCGNSFGDNDELNDFVKRKASGLGLRVQLESQSFLTCLDDDDKKHMIERQLVQLNRERGRHYYDYIVDRDSCKRPKDRPKRKLILEWMQYLLAKEDGAHLRYWRWTCNRAKGIEDVVGAGLMLTSEGDKIELRLARLY